MAAKVYMFKITYQGLDEKIWRLAEVSSKFPLDRLGYLVLATFDTLANHIFEFSFGNTKFCLPNDEIPGYENEKYIDAASVRLEQLELSVGDSMLMNYDLGTTQTFRLKLISITAMSKGSGRHYPWILDGAGRGILDDYSAEDVLKLVRQIDRNGHTNEPIYYNGCKVPWDYRNYDCIIDNGLLKWNIDEIADGYAPFWGYTVPRRSIVYDAFHTSESSSWSSSSWSCLTPLLPVNVLS